MPRDKTKKIDNNEDTYAVNAVNAENPEKPKPEEPKKKRKYVRKKPYVKRPPKPKPPPKKRGRKRGRKKKDEQYMMKPEEFIDYAIRNFPNMGFDRIREKFIDGVKLRNGIESEKYIMDTHLHNNQYYWKDKYGAIFNLDGQFVAHLVDKDGEKKFYFLEDSDDDTRTFEEVEADIEKELNGESEIEQTDESEQNEQTNEPNKASNSV